jgi:LDH2 family malate/lactate/ureidoglycolate dehydrogenase
MLALEKDMIGLAMTNASPLVAPTFSSERLLGTNPIALAIPAGEEPSFVADFATSTVSNGKLEILERKNAKAPFGWAVDKEGKPTDNPSALRSGGALVPLGSDEVHSSHKGFCLGAMVDIMSAVLSGAGYGPWAPPFVSFLPLPSDPVGQGLGHFLGAWRVDAFRPKEEFLMHMDNWIRRFRGAKPVEGQERVIIPGTPELEAVTERLLHGIPIIAPVCESLAELAGKFSLEMPSSK